MQKDGLEAIGALVERDFGKDGVFVGTVVGFREEKGVERLYRVKYSDGDVGSGRIQLCLRCEAEE